MKLKKIAALLAVASPMAMTAPAFATNGMNMEGYGPIATGMGGASMAYDNGTAGLINNPATLGLMKSGTSRFDLALGALNPTISASMPGAASASAESTSYYMPAMGYVERSGNWTWGIGMMAQGGMGTEYGKSSFLSGFQSLAGTRGASGQEVRSELGLGRVMLPLVFNVSDNVTVGGTFDYLWGGLDLSMPMTGQQFGQFMTPGNAAGSVSGTMVNALSGSLTTTLNGTCTGVAALGGGCLTDVNYAAFSFSEGKNKMTQRATMTGSAANLGFTWKATPRLSLGGVYHTRTNMSDMSGSAKMIMSVNVGAVGGAAGSGTVTPMTINGKIKIINFQWPETYGLGLSYQASDKWQVVADYKRIGWASVMRNFRMQFTAADGAFAGTVMNATINQNWSDQNVFQIGASYKLDDAMTLRFGVNVGNSPVSDRVMNPLFPAIMTSHFTLGLGTALSKTSGLDFSLTHAPRATSTNAATVSASMSQTNWQAMFSQRF